MVSPLVCVSQSQWSPLQSLLWSIQSHHWSVIVPVVSTTSLLLLAPALETSTISVSHRSLHLSMLVISGLHRSSITYLIVTAVSTSLGDLHWSIQSLSIVCISHQWSLIVPSL